MSKQFYLPMRDANDPHKVTLIPVSEEVYANITPETNRIRSRRQYHGQCCCPKQYLWKCDGDCDVCEYRAAGDNLSLDYETEMHGDTFADADNSVYYVINNNAGYDGDLEVALITTDFATAILGEQLDAKGVLVERNDAETSQFALMFEFDGDKNHIRHVLYCCSASRPATEGETTEESKSVKTEKLSLKASALPNGLVKSKTCESTDQTTYDNWYNAVYMPTAATNNSTGTRSAGTTKSGSATE